MNKTWVHTRYKTKNDYTIKDTGPESNFLKETGKAQSH
jgi:hypothetical protein